MSGETYSSACQCEHCSTMRPRHVQPMAPPHCATSPSDQMVVIASLRLVGALGLTVVALITGCFLGGLWVSRRYGLGMLPVIAGVVMGVVLSFVWTYQRLVRHLAAPVPGTGRGVRGGEDADADADAEAAGRKWPSS